MDIEKAIDCLKADKEYLTDMKICDGEEMDIVIKALEKQVPKKPHKNFEKFSGVWCSCGKYLGKGCFVDKPNYCMDCGQKLDWGDEE